ncbi:MAG: O-antigen ligase family protein [Clostridia bacterium]|nr:O-antigen ligase family protein [Clostridia bacterium]
MSQSILQPKVMNFNSILFVLLGGLTGLALLMPEAAVMLAALGAIAVFYLLVTEASRSLWLVISYVIVDYVFRKGPVTALAGSWDELLFIFVIGAWLAKLAWEKLPQYRFTPLDWPIITFLAIGVFLLFIKSPDMRIAIEGLRAVIQYIFWFFVAVNLIRTKEQVHGMLVLGIFVVSVIALYGVYQWVTGAEIPPEWIDKAEKGIRTRAFGISTIGSPNVLGSMMVLFIPITISLILAVKTLWKKSVLGVALATMGLCVVFTYSRGAWLALIGALAFYGVLRDKRILALMLIGALLAPIAVPSVAARMSYMLSPEYIKSSWKGGRLGRWDMALDRAATQPITGVGLGRFGGAVAARNELPGTKYVDNYYLKTLAEMGAIGLAAMLWLFFSCIRFGTNIYTRLRDPYLHNLSAGILAGLLGVLLHNGVENIFEVPMMSTYFWFLLGMLGTFRYLESKN